MAKKLKFGNGTWATKKGSTLAYNDENDRYKPLPFTTTRDSIATRVNKEGLIEVVGNDVPRIDYTDSADGVLLLENSSTNLIPYSEDFSQSGWQKYRSSILSNNAISPDGTLNADKFIDNSDNGTHAIEERRYSLSSGSQYTYSFFAKASEIKQVGLLASNPSQGSIFDLENGVVYGDLLSAPNSSKIENFGNGWYKCSMTTTLTGTNSKFGIYLVKNGSNNYSGNGTDGLYIYGAMLEQNSVATSYIPTSGSTVTRAADTANGSGNSEVFNDSEGVLFADISALANDGTARRISISNGSSSNNIFLSYRATANQVRANISGSYDKTITISNTLLYNKLLIKYKSGDISFWINGFEVDTSTSGISINGLNTLNFDGGLGFQDFYGKTKELGYYDTALTDEELEYITSYRSLNELVTELNLNEL